ncbi:TMEM175 family protein [Haloprofundus salilacus]|uniref:TMEM175 family protein n=1 Tax=Haloprofundus salilacus TaxID=2876190 RepID=UPI001CCD508D|nr:TMEM175 family protein [Haloprofundus salilacus]
MSQLEAPDARGRIDALSDGLFAIVLTLLVLQFEVPSLPHGRVGAELLAALWGMRSLVFSYLLSFFSVSLYWVVHHDLFRHVVDYDRRLLYLNFVYLLFVSFLPFPTELLGIYGGAVAWTLYALNLATIGILTTVLWWYTASYDLLEPELGLRTTRLIVLRSLIAPTVFLLSIGVAAVDVTFAYVTPFLIGPLQSLWTRRFDLSDYVF